MPAPTVPDWFWKQRDDLLSEITRWFTQLKPLPRFTVATKPDATRCGQCLIYLSDGASNKRVAVSDGAVWRYMDGNAV